MDAESGSSSPNRLPPSLIGETLGRYKIEKRLGAGGMGEVYLAWDTTLRRHVAIKRMATTGVGDEPFSSRLIKEAQNASSISDPRIAEVYDVLCVGDEIFLVLEYVDGQRLRDQMSSPLDLERFFDVAIPCVEALSAAHQAGIVHLDIKPENIMIKPSGQLKILDFGVAKRLPSPLASVESTHSLTYESLGGTPSYMAPEVLLGRGVDARADLYSLGVVFYEMLSGRRPFEGKTLAATIEQTLHGEAPDLASVAAPVPERLSHVVMRLLSKQPEVRHPSAQDLLADLLVAQRDTPGTTRTIGHPSIRTDERSTTRLGRSRYRLLAPGAIVALVLVALIVPGPRAWLLRSLRLHRDDIGNHIALLAVEAEEADVELAAFCNGLTEEVNGALLRLGGTRPLQVVRGSRVRALKSNSPRKAGEVLGVDRTIGGRLQMRNEAMSVEWVMRNADDGAHLRNGRASASVNDPLALAQASLATIGTLLDETIDPGARLALLQPGTRIPAAYHLFLEGVGYLQEPRQDTESARQSFTQALTLDPRLARAHVGLARAAWTDFGSSKNADGLRQALMECSAALVLDDICVEAYELRGFVLAASDSSAAAIAAFTRALQLEPRSEVARGELARLDERMGRDAEAERLYRDGIDLQPHSWVPYYRFGYFCFQRGRTEEAMQSFERVYALVPKYFSGYNALGGIYVLLGRYDQAVPILERSVRLRPSPAGYSNLGTAHFMRRNFAQAALVYQDAIQLGHADDRTWGNLGDAYYYGMAAERPRASEAYRRAIDMALAALPATADSVLVLSGLGKYHAQLGQTAMSLAFIGRALRADPGNPDVQYAAALVYMRADQPENAVGALTEALVRGYPGTWVRDTAELDELRSRTDFPVIPKATSTQAS